MKPSAKQYAQALFETLQSTNPKDQNQVLENFVKALAENNDLKMFDQIEEEFHRLELAAKGTTMANVTSAKPLAVDSEKQLVSHLNELVKGKVELKKKIDENLIGGVVIQMEDTVIDASVKRSLEDLKSNLEE
ncbi:MAG TPA: ATP synthase F1 subunit delta [Verrucomicrobiae bacterium]|nr:ATP synthase F1 subunit delta [Verrucomicrobiae bacterium]